MKIIRRKYGIIFLSFACFIMAACSNGGNTEYQYVTEEKTIEKKLPAHTGKKSSRSLYRENGEIYFETIPVYYGNPTNKVAYIDVAFVCDENGNRVDDVPFITEKDLEIFMKQYTLSEDFIKTDNYEKDGTITIERNDGLIAKGSKLIFTPDTSTVTFSTLNRFAAFSDAISDIDPTSGLPLKVESQTITKKGEDTQIILSDYDIDMICDKDKNGDYSVYLPAQTYVSFTNYLYLLYNGNALYLQYTPGGLDDPFIQESRFKDKEKSSYLKNFVANDTAYAIENLYGLKKEHGITDAKSYFDTIGIDDSLKGNVTQSFDALCRIIRNLDDGHSYLNYNNEYYSPFLSTEINRTIWNGPCSTEIGNLLNTYKGERGTYTPYQEYTSTINNQSITTAYLTFDSFEVTRNNYKELVRTYPPSDFQNINKYMDDIVSMVTYANAQIRRTNSPVKNLVIDISANGGGNIATGFYLACWLLNSYGTTEAESSFFKCSYRNPNTGAECTTAYKADIDWDGDFDSNDSLPSNVNVYILTGPGSFSCANIVSLIAKSSKKISLIGKRTGGGSCAVLNRATPDGICYTLSSYMQSSLNVNGAFYNTDQGIDPDYPLDTIESFYDRDGLNKYIYKIQNPGFRGN